MAKQRSFFVKAMWDEEAKVFVSESDIIGLHIEAETLKEFEAVLFEEGPQLIFDNHITREELSSRSIADLFKGIIWQPPAEPDMACA